ncbi:hypothetical protein L7F22_045457 [Adiantum nelumboides]|nr:hypothetical protein [Adiantum nelumboides]
MVKKGSVQAGSSSGKEIVKPKAAIKPLNSFTYSAAKRKLLKLWGLQKLEEASRIPLDEGLKNQAASSFDKNTYTIFVKGRTIQFSLAAIEHIFQLPNAPAPKTCTGEDITIYLQASAEQVKKRKAVGQGILVERLQHQKAYRFTVEAMGMKSNSTYILEKLFGMLLAREQDSESPINLLECCAAKLRSRLS